ncbi:hypothetical protein [Pedobacter cryoconitis]|nr:hypothetical protein [Pedobacter cryoconitis]
MRPKNSGTVPARLTAKKIIRYKYLLPTPDGDPGKTSKIFIAHYLMK